MRRSALIFCFGFAILFLLADSAIACSCSRSCWAGQSREACAAEWLERSPGAFLGEVLEVKIDGGGYRTKFRILKAWKYRLEESMVIRSYPSDGGNCGVTFAVGQTYLIFPRYRSRFNGDATSCDVTDVAFAEYLGKPLRPKRK